MKIGLVDVDGHAKKKKWGATIYPNLALAKLAAYHKNKGDDVEFANPFFHYDIIYKSKIFTFSRDDGYYYNADKIICGGTGYDIKSKLPDEIDMMQPNLSIYPNVPKDYAYGFLTRGCPNKCSWCVVPRKEGMVRPYMDIEEIAINWRNKVVLMDNNILAAGDYAIEQLNKIIRLKLRVDFNQALDARLVNDEFAYLLARIKWLGNRIRFGCDTHAQIEQCEKAIDKIMENGYKGGFFLYTMIGGKNGFHECYERVNHWRERLIKARKEKGGGYVYPYAQPYLDPDKSHHDIPQWQKDMAQYTNKHMIFYACDFKDFEPRKGFKCNQYFLEQNSVK